MFIKYERKSDRVKAVSFHHVRPWLLMALHSGLIELVDYRLKQRIAVYEDHQGPVRSVQFHPNLSLFCSGGDDFTVRVFGYKGCQFILKGHLDYVRCVSFHPTMPWVLSGSDDQTARVWNYQSRQTIAILTGHTHYIMQCAFHPTQELIVTCSLDQSARLWSYGVLKQRYAQKSRDYVLSGAEVTLISIMDAHKDQLNWCAFHHTQPFIITAADDKKIKIWKYNDSKAWEFDTLSGHNGNVCSVAYHMKEDVIISDSEDHTVKVWDATKRCELATYENKSFDRYWVVSCHPDNYYFACGSDSSVQVFTLHKDRIPMTVVSDRYLCIGQKKIVKVIEMTTKQEQLIKDLSGLSNISSNLLEDNIEHLEYNIYDTSKTQLLVRCIRNHQDINKSKKHVLVVFQQSDVKQFTAKCACFIGRTKIVKVNDQQHLEIYNYETDNITQLLDEQYEKVFPYVGGKILAYRTGKLDIIDPISKHILHTTDSTAVKQIKVTDQYIVCLSKLQLCVYTKQLQRILCIEEPINLKSVIWADKILIYTNKSQIKFALLNGDNGIIKSTENIIYLAKGEMESKHLLKLTAIDNRGEYIQFTVDIREAIFKQAVYLKDVNQIREFVQEHNEEAVLSYLYKKKLASVALKLVKDTKARFSLSIDCGNLEIAYRIACDAKDPELYEQLRDEALRQGNHQLVDVCDQQLRQLDRLAFLYLCVGATDKLNKISKINNTYQNTLYTGNLEDRINILSQSLPKLTTLVKAVHGERVSLDSSLHESLEWIKSQNPTALVPPVPISRMTEAWPHNYLNEQQQLKLEGEDQPINLPEDDLFTKKEQVIIVDDDPIEPQDDDQWGIDSMDDVEPITTIQAPTFDTKCLQDRPIESTVAAVHFAGGSYEIGFKLLKEQINLQNKEPLLKLLRQQGNCNEQSLSGIPYIQSGIFPIKVSRLQEIRTLTKLGYKYTTEAKFSEVASTFQLVLQKLLLLNVNVADQQEVITTREIAKNYILAMRCDQIKKESNSIEMACKMASMDLLPVHRILTLRQALSVSYKLKNYITCQSIAARLIVLLKDDTTQKPEVLQNAIKYEKACSQQKGNAVQIEFHADWLQNNEQFSAATLKHLKSYKQCMFDGAAYELDYNGICVVCGICEVKQGSGWIII